MPVTEVLRGVGSWSVKLSSSTPLEIMQNLSYFGHICIVPGQLGELDMTDALLKPARYVGVFRGKSVDGSLTTIEGAGMAHWMGDEEDKGDVIESLMTFTAATFQSAVGQVLTGAASVEEGTVYNVPSAPFTATLQYLTRRRALDYICDTLGGDWRINGDATVDAGLESDLFQVVPQAILSPKTGYQSDMFLESIGGEASTDQSMEDFTTRTLLLASGSEAATVTATADINPALNVYKDLLGNPVKITRMISESETDASNAQARAQLQLNRFSGTTDSLRCSTEKYDLKGTVEVGDYISAFAPEEGVYDLNNEVQFNGDRIYPMRLRLIQMSWPIVAGMSVAFRDKNGNWYDLTPYVNFESGPSHLQVGGYNRTLVAGRDGGPMGSRPIADTSVPGVPTWVTPFVQSVYQSPIRGETRAQAILKWTRPANVDGTAILDGSHFEIRYRTSTTPIFPSSHAQMSLFTHGQLAAGTHAQPITYTAGGWQYQVVPWSELEVLLQDLVSNMPYEAQIRAVDSAKPANASSWSALTNWQTHGDTIPPAVPAAPTVAASRIAVQIKHFLGRSDGGTFNLDADLHHLEVHGEYEPLFTPTDSTLLGKLPANNSMIQSQVPVVGTFQIESLAPVYFKVIAVDNDGNKSAASPAAVATALLIDDAHISSLTVSKVTAGTITADWLIGAKIQTGSTGARVFLGPTGLEAYNASNVRTVFIAAATGSADFMGILTTGLTARRVRISDTGFDGGSPGIQFYPSASANYARIGSIADLSTGGASLLIESGTLPSFLDNVTPVRNSINMSTGDIFVGQMTSGYVVHGGKIQVGGAYAYLGYQTPGGIDAFFGIGGSGDLQFKGKIQRGQSHGGQAAFWANYAAVGGGAANFAYGATMQGDIVVLASWTDYTGYLKDTVTNVYNTGSTGFTVGNSVGARNGHFAVLAMRFG